MKVFVLGGTSLILTAVMILVWSGKFSWPDLLNNLIAEAAGVVVTVGILQEYITYRERKEWDRRIGDVPRTVLLMVQPHVSGLLKRLVMNPDAALDSIRDAADHWKGLQNLVADKMASHANSFDFETTEAFERIRNCLGLLATFDRSYRGKEGLVHAYIRLDPLVRFCEVLHKRFAPTGGDDYYGLEADMKAFLDKYRQVYPDAFPPLG